MPDPEDPSTFSDLVAIMHRLRAPGGCPWDAEQTHETLKPYLIEEAYEVVEALEAGSDPDLCDELGDLLLQVVFHAELAVERDAFTIEDVVNAISQKLVRRHPHVFADADLKTSAEVAANWSRIKAEEKAARDPGGAPPSAIGGVPRALPALIRGHRLGEKAASVGFDWPSARGARAKIDEELAEVDASVRAGDRDEIARELGDLLFAIASYARLLGVNAENAMGGSLERFQRRFEAMEADLAAAGRDVHEATAADLEECWERVKAARAG